mgnify:CR=1 FL=1
MTVTAIVGLAYLGELFGHDLHAGPGCRIRGLLFPLLSAFLGWLAVFLSGSDSSGNALFGNLQVVAANKLGFDPVLMAATNSSGGVFAKMISPQNIATGVAVSDLKGHEVDDLPPHLHSLHHLHRAAGHSGVPASSMCGPG